MREDIATLIRTWNALGRQRSACINPATKQHLQLWHSANGRYVLMHGITVGKNFSPQVVFALDENKELIDVQYLWADYSAESEKELVDALEYIVKHSASRSIISSLKSMPRDKWKDTTYGNTVFYSSPLEKDILWLRHADSKVRDCPIEIDFVENVISYKSLSDIPDEPSLTQLDIIQSIKLMESSNAKSN